MPSDPSHKGTAPGTSIPSGTTHCSCSGSVRLTVTPPETKRYGGNTEVEALPSLSWLAPTINLSRRSGVPLEPLHRAQPSGIVEMLPCHMTMIPDGTPHGSITIADLLGAAVITGKLKRAATMRKDKCFISW